MNSAVADCTARIDSFIADNAPEFSRSQVKKAIEAGQIAINGRVCDRASLKVQAGDRVTWDIPMPADAAHPVAGTVQPFDILFEDEHILVIDKPAGLVVHPGAGHVDGTLVNGLLAKYPEIAQVGESDRPGIVHRLDAETSGLLLVARSQKAYETLVPMFAKHDVHRQYMAICLAPKLPDGGHFDTPYGRHPTQRVKFTSRFDADKRAVTDYRVLSRNAQGYALVTCLLQTGRTHQVRVHLSEHNAPILGDPLYAPATLAKTKIISRLALHAYKLAFMHPITEEQCEFIAPFPADFQAALDKLRLQQPIHAL